MTDRAVTFRICGDGYIVTLTLPLVFVVAFVTFPPVVVFAAVS
ncbi:hypothetical protein [Halococcus salifodinae]|nr:hypothetical protein [Halococcus salifodinae]